MMNFYPIIIENISPTTNSQYPIKRVIGDTIKISADIFTEGLHRISACVKLRMIDQIVWSENRMYSIENDRWIGHFSLDQIGVAQWTIEAWQNPFYSWYSNIDKQTDSNYYLFAQDGALIIKQEAEKINDINQQKELIILSEKLILCKTLDAIVSLLSENNPTIDLLKYRSGRENSIEYTPYSKIRIDRNRARFATWYEFFPRSAEGKSYGSTFRQCLQRVEDARNMGFNVIYFPPIHPIGVTARKGPNNSLVCKEGDPGVPYAIGNRHGGHMSIAPELGTMSDFIWLIKQIKLRSMEIALDFAINCSPDHPYLKEHPNWFFYRADGSIQCAENPPKKYEDVLPLNFYNSDWKNLWNEMKKILLFWAEKGVRIFRVDNPHTKPFSFWEWVIDAIQKEYPDVIFLSEAFTRPSVMYALAKIGFTQSYTYFTWRNSADEIREYFQTITSLPISEYFRPNLFVNTPDILPYYLQVGGKPAFMIRAVLAGTLSSVYGIYSGFELCENTAIPHREEYLDSEKYQYKIRDWNSKNNIKDFLRKINSIRNEYSALQIINNLKFYSSDNSSILAFAKISTDSPSLLIIVTTDFLNFQSAWIDIDLSDFCSVEHSVYEVEDLLTSERYVWNGNRNYVAFQPDKFVAHIFKIITQ